MAGEVTKAMAGCVYNVKEQDCRTAEAIGDQRWRWSKWADLAACRRQA